MTMRRITAGDGYAYLTRQVATGDSTELGRDTLTDYYSDKGEAPGIWYGAGLANLGTEHGLTAGDTVTAEQMKALFGEGLHPNADAIMREVIDKGGTVGAAQEACKLGRPFNVGDNVTAFRVAVAQRFDAYNKGVGAKWDAPIPAEDRARIRTEVATAMFTSEYGRAPVDERELSGWTAKLSRQNTTDVAGFDLAFTPPKSVSVLWALAPEDVARVIEECHDGAVRDTLDWLEKHAAFSRIGDRGVGQVDVDGLMVAAFNHRDSRSGDPNLHTHAVVSNPVRVTMPNGQTRWLRLDSQTLYKMNVPGSEFYNTRIVARMMAALPVDFEARNPAERSPVMELVGYDPSVCEAFSSRRAMIERRISVLAREFAAKHGREPSPVESLDLAQQANLETRQGKHEPQSRSEQRADWREFVQARGVDPDAYVAGQLAAPVRDVPEVGDAWFRRRGTRSCR